jgi:predicted DNA-binding protein (UPF0251 family)
MKKPSDKNPPDSRRHGSPPGVQSRQRTPQEKKDDCDEVLRLMAHEGLSAFKATKQVGVSWTCWNEWVSDSPELADKYARARNALLDRMAQEIADIADEPVILTPDGKLDSAAVQKQRLQIDTRKWLLSKLAPKKYGERLELAGDADSPLKAAVTVEFVKAKS